MRRSVRGNKAFRVAMKPSIRTVLAVFLALGATGTQPYARATIPPAADPNNSRPDTPQLTPPEAAPAIAGTILRVNSDVITSAEILNLCRNQLAELAQSLDKQTFLTRAQPILLKITTAEVYNLLLYQQAQQDLKRLENADEIIAAQMAQQRKTLIAQYGGSEARAQAELAAQDSSIEQQLQSLRREMIIAAYRQARFDPTFEITRAQIWQYYRAHRKEDYSQEPTIRFQLIDIPVKAFLPKDSPQQSYSQRQLSDARRKAAQMSQAAWETIQNGADFGDVAKDFSHGIYRDLGGLWRPRNPDTLTAQYKPVVAALAQIKPGQCSGIIETPDHFFITKLIDRRPASVVPFTQAQVEIAQKLRDLRWMRFRQKLAKELLEKSTIGDLQQFVLETGPAAYRQFRLNAK